MAEENGITIVVRLIRSFPHRNIRSVTYHNVDTNQSVSDFINFVKTDLVNKTTIPPPFRKYAFETMKIQHKAFGAKTSDPVINTTNDAELMLIPNKTLKESGIENETEVSFFILEEYRKYQENPQLIW